MYTHTSVLISSRTHQTLYVSSFDKKYVSALGACSQLIAIARTCMNHDAALQEKMLHRPVLGFSTPHGFLSELMMSTKVPLFLLSEMRNKLFNNASSIVFGICDLALIGEEGAKVCLELFV